MIKAFLSISNASTQSSSKTKGISFCNKLVKGLEIRPLTNLLQKDVPFVFDDDCVEAFEILKKALISAPIVQPPDWNLPFKIMCDASDYVVGVVLGPDTKNKHRPVLGMPVVSV